MRSTDEPSEPTAVLDHIGAGTDLIVPLANGEPVAVLDAVEAAADTLEGVRVHQMHALHPRDYFDGRHGGRLRHVSYFLSHVTRPHLHSGGLDLVPAHFSEVPALLEHTCGRHSSWPRPLRRTATGSSRWAPTPTTWPASSAAGRCSWRPIPGCRGPSATTWST